MFRGVPTVLARGGASRGLIVLRDDLRAIPEDRWPALFGRWLGSPDPTGRQVDGVGGGNPSTSKVVVLGPSEADDCDLDYSFFQIDPRTGGVETRGTCGNMTAAAGLVAVRSQLVAPSAPDTVVRLRDTNTDQRVDVTVPLDAVPSGSNEFGRARPERQDPPIVSTFRTPAGPTTGRLLPTGSLVDRMRVGDREVPVMLVDAVNPVVLVDGDAIGLDPSRTAADLEADEQLIAVLQSVRAQAAVACGFADSVDRVPELSSFYPFVGVVASPAPYATASGEPIAADQIDAVVRMMSGPTVHRALPMSAALGTACALFIAGRTGGDGSSAAHVRLGHPSGILTVEVSGTQGKVESVSVQSTARVIMSGYSEFD